MLFQPKSKISKLLLLIFTLAVIEVFIFPQYTLAQDENYPKIANCYTGWDIDDDGIRQMAKWDFVTLPPQALERNPQIISKLKKINPNIKVSVYILIQEINVNPKIVSASQFYQLINDQAQKNNWWLKTSTGQNVSYWPETWMINGSSTAPKTNGQNWSDYLPQLIYDQFLKNDEWDGVYFDNLWNQISWITPNIDINGDGQAESKDAIDQKWREGMSQILAKTHDLAPNKIITANSYYDYYNNLLNGRMHEQFPHPNEGDWSSGMEHYLDSNFGLQPPYFILNVNLDNREFNAATDYKNFRYGLSSALLGDGYYSFDKGSWGRDRFWWYDEYNVYLGKAVSQPKNLLDPSSAEIKPGVWQRDFQNGLSLVNSTSTEQKITFVQEFEKIKGTQDKATNNGAILKNLTLQPNDGLILLRRIEDITNAPYFNGSFVRVFNKTGDSIRNGFFIYEKDFKGNNVLAKQDINKDGVLEIIVADNSKITIYDLNKKILASFYPYGQNYNKGINLAISDFENDGYYEIVTGTQKGFAPLVKIFNSQGEPQGQGFYAYAKSYLGGVNVAVGDLSGNGQKQIVTGTGFMGGPQVRIFDKNGKVLSGGFFAYGTTFRGGVNVAVGDIDGNGKDEIVTGAGYGGSSHVRIFNSKFQALNPGFFAYGKDTKTGVRVFLTDLDNDGAKEILAATPDTFTTALKK